MRAAEESEGGVVAEDVRRRILRMLASGALRPGDRLGTEREMAARFSVSRTTLRSALVPLSRAGVLERRTGRSGGTFVRRDVVEREAAELLGVPDLLASAGHRSATVLRSALVRPATDVERAALAHDGPQVVEVARTRYADGIPLSLESARFPADLVPGLPGRDLTGSLYRLLADDYGLAVGATEEQITVVLASAAEAKELEVPPGSPLLHISRVSTTPGGVPFECSEDLFRADRVRLTARRRTVDPDTGGSPGGPLVEIPLGDG
ncbi:GntR family transcriptional regulator [Nocardioides sp. YIM 152588]|uniref:GntR family transcriptional regulator n=1 Tax=Nocardioides sp. YIM 152588 TaxID=3158259 RepID=UPI0032E4FE8F